MRRFLLREMAVVALVSLCWVALVDRVTNDLDVRQRVWDFRHYIAMAEYGLEVDHHVAPYAYRFGLTMPVHVLWSKLGVPVAAGFELTAYLGACSTLLMVYWLVRWSGFPPTIAALGSVVVGLSHYHVKFLVFDVYRPDHLAYPLMVVAMMGLLARRGWLVVLVCIVGIQVREFLAVPLLILIGHQAAEAITRTSRRKRAALSAAIGLAALLVAVVLPRLLIPVTSSQQNIDPWHDPATLTRLASDLLDPGKGVNLLLALLTYLVPTLLLLTPRRARRVWARLEPVERWIYSSYAALVLVLTAYGGTDYNRFVTYLFIPQVVLLAHLASDRAHRLEVVYMLVVVALVNKLLQPIPIWDLDAYLDWFGGYGGRVNLTMVPRFAQLVLAVLGAALVRWLIARREQADANPASG
jgi:hypothetical protein